MLSRLLATPPTVLGSESAASLNDDRSGHCTALSTGLDRVTLALELSGLIVPDLHELLTATDLAGQHLLSVYFRCAKIHLLRHLFLWLGVGRPEQQADQGSALCFDDAAAAAAACFGACRVVVALRAARLGVQVPVPSPF